MRAHVEIREWDLSTRVPSFPGIYGGMVIPAAKGEVNKPRLVTNETQLLRYFTPDEVVRIGYDSSYYSALAFLIKSNKLWIVRAANNPLYGGAYLSQDIALSECQNVSFNKDNGCITLPSNTTEAKAKSKAFYSLLATSEKVTVASEGGGVPAGLLMNTTYYAILFDEDKLKIQIAETQEKAEDGEFVPFSDEGTGILIVRLVGDKANGEAEFGMKDPMTYELDSSNGRYAGLTTAFSTQLDRDSFKVSKAFHDMIATGDTIQLAATVLPGVERGDELDGATNYFLIKSEDLEEVKLARSEGDANVGVHIDLTSPGSSVVATLQNKTKEGLVVADNTDESFTVPAEFYAAVVSGDTVRYTTSDAYPTVDSGAAFDQDTNYFLIKGAVNEIKLARTTGGAAITFSDDGTGDQRLTLQAKDNTSTLAADLSEDELSISVTFYDWTRTGDKVQVSTTSVLPEGLEANTDYFVIKLEEEGKVKIASSPTAAEIGMPINVNSAGEGIHTLHNKQNEELIGLERKCLLIYGCNQGDWNDDILITTIHYPYAKEDNWSEQDRLAAEAVKEPDCFKISVYQKTPENMVATMEEWLCSRYPNKKDGYGNNCYVEDVLEKSNYVRAIDNKGVEPHIFPKNQDQILALVGGDDGGQVSDTHMLQALTPLQNKRDLFVTILMDGGWCTPAYQKQGLISTAETRKDCFAILGVPIAKEQSSNYMNEVLAYRKEELNANSSYAGLFTSHLLIQDKYNDRKIFVPADGYIGAAISVTASNWEIWYPPAGPRRGILKVLDVARRYTEGEMDVLYDNGINPIDFYPGKGIRIWGQKTLLARPSSLDRINVRLLLITIEPAIAEFLEDFLFELNDEKTRVLIRSGIMTYMEGIKARRGVYDFNVTCDDSNNSPEDIDANLMNVWLFVQPTKAVEFIKFTTIITRTGASFSI
jgi:hypothetical protein